MYIASIPCSGTAAGCAASSSGSASEDSSVEVLVKFTKRYNAKAHRILDEEGFAPRLYSCSRVYGDLYMVVMEYLVGETMFDRQEAGKSLPQSLYTDVDIAIGKLHEADIVFGDLCLPNIMCVPESGGPSGSPGGLRAKLVDFDWAGTDGEDTYPVTLNDKLPDWVGGMERGEVMRKEYDIGLLEMVRMVCVRPLDVYANDISFAQLGVQ
ncbi:uncharacterized protein PHACADRAFT_265818 [Phanerochaete carnosa HHB-10118-sp]|uniref:Protein kinase domain-containing protein n=1 Tax=Phanerochaete carnosa (strain HHB-10118-sp) TaxID=650164 RepID=K5WFZ4_PHACS|nr:uncharacterized protein PHACADRAFT_265818 [Phanerochaete carnosa HHB-10118-sp]EKM49127.1 hypothetical protein PHACADRAFT_265818 [Phanerochaete carnosa HHB-10118-sp]